MRAYRDSIDRADLLKSRIRSDEIRVAAYGALVHFRFDTSARDGVYFDKCLELARQAIEAMNDAITRYFYTLPSGTVA